MQLEIKRKEIQLQAMYKQMDLVFVRLKEVAATLPIGKNKQNKRLNGGLRRSRSLS